MTRRKSHQQRARSGRRLRHEALEDRRLLAADLGQISGVVTNDLNGDRTGTAFASGVGVELFLDDGSTVGVLDASDTSKGTDTTDTNGAYHFDNLEAGSYFVKITPDAGQQIRTNGDVSSIIMFDADEAAGNTSLTIDTFDTAQSANVASNGNQSTAVADGENTNVGGVRDLRVDWKSGDGQINLVSKFVGTNVLNLATTGNVTGIASVVWDGPDGSAVDLNASGLSLDLSNNGANTALLLTASADPIGSSVTIRLHSGSGNTSEATVPIVDTVGSIEEAADVSISIPFASFNTTSGTGADLSNIGAIEMVYDFQSPGLGNIDAQFGELSVAGFTTKTADFTVLNEMSLGDQVWIDLDNDGIFDAGEEGVEGVAVTLYEDTNGDGDYTDEVSLKDTTTDASGNYLFEGLFPSDYIVQIDQANFDSGSALEGLATSTGNDVGGMAPDPDTADDNNTDKGTLQSDGSVVSQAVTLIANTEPTNDGDTDNNSNLTLDFGFFGFDVTIAKQVDQATAAPGATLVYTIIVTNDGPSTATDVDLTDTLPTGVTFVSGTTSIGGQSVSGNSGSQTVTSTIGNLPSGQFATITITATIDFATTGTLTNRAVTSATNESNLNNNTATAETLIQPEIDLSISKVDNDNDLTLLTGDTIQYTIDVTNNGPSTATNVEIIDTLPEGVTFVSGMTAVPGQTVLIDFSGSAGSQTVTSTISTLLSGQTATMTIDVTVDPNATGTLTNRASVSGSEFDPELSNNSESTSTEVSPSIDLSISKIDNDNNQTLFSGGTIQYTIGVTNGGPSDATGVTVVDVLPTGLTFNATGSTAPISTVAVAGGTQLTYSLGALANGVTFGTPIIINATIGAAFTGTLTNEATVSGFGSETDSTNNTASAESEVVAPTIDLSITKVDDDNDLTLLSGDTIQYTIDVTNNGPSTATNVELIDTLPEGVAFVSGTTTVVGQSVIIGGSGSGGSRIATSTIGTLLSGQTATITIDVAVDPNVTGTLTNRASVSGSEAETDSSNNEALTQTNVRASNDVAITLVDDTNGQTLLSGGSIQYTIDVTNNGPSNATGVTVVSFLPTGLTFNSSGSAIPVSTGIFSGGTELTFNVGPLARGATTSVIINTVIDSDFEGELPSLATVSSNEDDTDSTNNRVATQTVDVIAPATISGYVFLDASDNGNFGSSELPIPDVTLVLTGTDFQGNAVNRTTTTDSGGFFEFVNLNPGTYQVTETQPASFADGKDSSLFPGATVGQDVISSIVLRAGDDAGGNFFGELPLTHSLSGFKFNDLNGNGIWDQGLITGENPDVIFIIDRSGSMRNPFDGTSVGDVNGDGSSNQRIDAALAGLVALNESLIDQGLGDTARVSVITFGDSSRTDLPFANPIADIEEEDFLHDISTGGGTNFESALQAAVTAFNDRSDKSRTGNIIFLSDGVPNSTTSYLDEVEDLKNLNINLQAFGVGENASLPALQSIDSDAIKITTSDELIAALGGLNSGSGVTSEPALAGWTIYLDQNQNGVRDPSEQFTVTDSNGSYEFKDLSAGTYFVREELQSGWSQTAPTSGVFEVTLATGQNEVSYDFGNHQDVIQTPDTPTTPDEPTLPDVPPVEPVDPTAKNLLLSIRSAPSALPPVVFGGSSMESPAFEGASTVSRLTTTSLLESSGRGVDEMELQIVLDNLLDFIEPDLLPIDLGDDPPKAGSEAEDEEESDVSGKPLQKEQLFDEQLFDEQPALGETSPSESSIEDQEEAFSQWGPPTRLLGTNPLDTADSFSQVLTKLLAAPALALLATFNRRHKDKESVQGGKV